MTGVLVVAPRGDPHGDAVQQGLRLAGAVTARAALDIAGTCFSHRPGEGLRLDGHVISSAWTVWWHRTGTLPPVPGADPSEQELAQAEAAALLLGALLATGPVWVDEPATVERAEHTLLQLAVARTCGASVPATLSGSDPTTARAFLNDGPVIAKPVSSGPGLAPHAAPVTLAMLPALAGAPTLLQRHIRSVADLRVVIVKDRALAWRRQRTPDEPVDWRAADPAGTGFAPVPVPAAIQGPAVATCRGLGLTTCVQDWVVDSEGTCWFLEANPVGRWLFLHGASDTVPALLAAHLTSAVRSAR